MLNKTASAYDNAEVFFMQNREVTGGNLFQIIKAVAFSLACSLLYAVVFAVILKHTRISDRAVYPINQTAKLIILFLGAFFFIKGEKGFLKGIAVGVLFCFLSYLTFSAFGGDFSLSWLIIIELILSAVTGLLGGVLAVNFRRN